MKKKKPIKRRSRKSEKALKRKINGVALMLKTAYHYLDAPIGQ